MIITIFVPAFRRRRRRIIVKYRRIYATRFLLSLLSSSILSTRNYSNQFSRTLRPALTDSKGNLLWSWLGNTVKVRCRTQVSAPSINFRLSDHAFAFFHGITWKENELPQHAMPWALATFLIPEQNERHTTSLVHCRIWVLPLIL